MSYLGKVALKASDIRRLDVTSSTSATHTLTWTPPNEQSLIITINGVKQQNNYTVSGVTLTLDTALISTDAMEVIGINDIGTTNVPGSGVITNDMLSSSFSVDTAELADDSVTADKLANSINTEIAANTAKVTNATHTGDVTGATALTIANDAVDIAMLSATGTADSTTFLRGDNSWVAAGGSNAPAFHVVKTALQTIADDTFEKVTWDSTIFDTNSGMSLVDNKWTVPSGEGGKYFVYAQVFVYSNASHALQEINLPEVRIDGTAKMVGNWRSVTYPAAQFALCTSGILILSAAEYIEIWAHANVSSSDTTVGGYASGKHTFFGAYKLDGIA